MRVDKEDAFSVGRSKAAGTAAVELRRRQRQAGEKIGVIVGTGFALFKGVFVRGQDV